CDGSDRRRRPGARHHGHPCYARASGRGVRRPRGDCPGRPGQLAGPGSGLVVMRLGLRLTLAGGREAVVRLIITAMAVAVGVGLLLAALAGMNAINAQNNRTAWLNTGMLHRPATGAPTPAGAATHGRGP